MRKIPIVGIIIVLCRLSYHSNHYLRLKNISFNILSCRQTSLQELQAL